MTYSKYTTHICSLDYRTHKSGCLIEFLKDHCLWHEKGELASMLSWIQDGMYHPKFKDTPLIEAFSLVNNMVYDYYQNGGGNSYRWAISKDFQKNLNKCIKLDYISWKEKTSLVFRLQDVHPHIGRGRSFGIVQNNLACKHALELLLIDTLYYVGRTIFPNENVYIQEKTKEKLIHF